MPSLAAQSLYTVPGSFLKKNLRPVRWQRSVEKRQIELKSVSGCFLRVTRFTDRF